MGALTAVMPAVRDALGEHNDLNNNARIKDVVLPIGNYQVYRKVMAWLVACIADGEVVQFRRFNDPIVIYTEVQRLSRALGIGYLDAVMGHRLQKLVTA